MRLPLQRLQALLRLWMLRMLRALHKLQLELQWWWWPALRTSQVLLRLWTPLAPHKSQLELQWWWWPALRTSQLRPCPHPLHKSPGPLPLLRLQEPLRQRRTRLALHKSQPGPLPLLKLQEPLRQGRTRLALHKS